MENTLHNFLQYLDQLKQFFNYYLEEVLSMGIKTNLPWGIIQPIAVVDAREHAHDAGDHGDAARP